MTAAEILMWLDRPPRLTLQVVKDQGGAVVLVNGNTYSASCVSEVVRRAANDQYRRRLPA